MNYLDALKAAKATAADVKFVETYIAKHMSESNTKVVNPFSGWEKNASPLVAALTYFTQELIYSDFARRALVKWNVPEGKKVQLYDRARYLILKLDNEVYMNVID